VRERATEKSIVLNLKCPSDIGWIIADEMRLKQSVFTLLGSAVRFTSESGSVNLSCTRDTADLSISISYTGSDGPNAEHDEILKSLQLGYQPDNAVGNQGQGLSLVARFIDLHGGRIKIDAIENGGAIIVCRLPITSVAQS
ncbi:MAG: sensor histidine kinase, partial [Rhodospirillales bacterium]